MIDKLYTILYYSYRCKPRGLISPHVDGLNFPAGRLTNDKEAPIIERIEEHEIYRFN